MVTSGAFPFLEIRVSIREWETKSLALVDTGFSGDLVIPEGVLDKDVGQPDHMRLYRMADGRTARSDIFLGEVEIAGLAPMSDIAIGVLGNKYIIGLGIIERYVVTLMRGERVVVEE